MRNDHRITELGRVCSIPSTLGETVKLVLDDGTTLFGRVTRVIYIWDEGSMLNPLVGQVVGTEFGDIKSMIRYGRYSPGKTSRLKGQWNWSNVLPCIRSNRKMKKQRTH